MVLQIGEALRKAAEVVGPILIRELQKPRTRRIIEEKVGELAQELARRRFTGKETRNVITIRRGRTRFQCRRVN